MRHTPTAAALLVICTVSPIAAQEKPPPSPTPPPTQSPAPDAAKPATPPAAPIKAPTPAKIEQVRKTGAEGLLGQPVMDAAGDVFGNIVDVLIDADGTPHAAVIELTGFFGIGNRRVAVAWKALQFKTEQDHIAIHAPLDIPQLKAMPEYTQEAVSVPVATPAPPAAPVPAKPH